MSTCDAPEVECRGRAWGAAAPSHARHRNTGPKKPSRPPLAEVASPEELMCVAGGKAVGGAGALGHGAQRM